MNFKRFVTNPKPYIKSAISRVNNGLRTVLFRGNIIECEICKWHGKKFFDGKCPRCNSLARTRLVPFSLNYFKLDTSNKKLLHIAPNYNEYQFVKTNFSDLAVYDRLNIRSVPHINIVQDLTKSSIQEESYDLAIAWHVLEHIKEDRLAIKNVFRILKPGGQFLVSVPIYPLQSEKTYESDEIIYEDYEQEHGHYDHCRSCGLDYYKRFEDAGFSTRTLMIKDIDDQVKTKYGLFEHHVVWCFEK